MLIGRGEVHGWPPCSARRSIGLEDRRGVELMDPWDPESIPGPLRMSAGKYGREAPRSGARGLATAAYESGRRRDGSRRRPLRSVLLVGQSSYLAAAFRSPHQQRFRRQPYRGLPPGPSPSDPGRAASGRPSERIRQRRCRSGCRRPYPCTGRVQGDGVDFVIAVPGILRPEAAPCDIGFRRERHLRDH